MPRPKVNPHIYEALPYNGLTLSVPLSGRKLKGNADKAKVLKCCT